MGEVYLAQDESSGQSVALKILSQRFLDDDVNFERFVREAILTSHLRHPNIVRVFELGEHDGRYYIAMEYVDGPSLQSRLRLGAIRIAEAVEIMCQVLGAMDLAHGQGIVHCDLKPGNILLANGTTPKVTDLGIAHTQGPIHGDSPLPAVGRATPFYVAPEQCSLGRAVDHRADIYALGATLYHMLCGMPPFVGDTSEALLEQHLYAPPPDPRTRNCLISHDLAAVVLHMLAKDPADRPARCSDVRRRLCDLTQKQQLSTHPATWTPDQAAEMLEETATLPPPNA
jgi:serine/threonine-protein kinase